MKDRLGDKIRLQHIVDSIEEIKTYLIDSTYKSFKEQSMLKSACIRQLEIIGEASGKISDQIRKNHPQVSWKSLIGLRNILIHKYFGVDERIVWDVLQNDIPNLEAQIRKILKEIEEGE